MPAPLDYLVSVEGTSESAGELEEFGGAIDRVDKKAQETTSSNMQLSGSVSQAALGFSTAASGAFALFSQYDQLEKMELRIAQAEKSRDSAARGVIEAEEALKKLTAEGIASGPDYESALLRLSTAQQQLEIAEQKVGMAQDDLTQGQIGFALTVAPTVFGAISGITTAMTALRGIQTASSLAQAASVPVTAADTAAKGALATATGAAATATGGLSMATRLLQIAMGPVGWIILGVGTFLALFATNAFGVRDAINAMGKAIGDAIPILRPLLDALGSLANSIFPETKDKSEETSEEMTEDFDAVKAKYMALVNDVESNSNTMVGSFDATGAAYQQMATTTQTQSDVIANALSTSSTQGRSSLRELDAAFGATSNSIVNNAKRAERAVRDLTDALKDMAKASKSTGKSDTLKNV